MGTGVWALETWQIRGARWKRLAGGTNLGMQCWEAWVCVDNGDVRTSRTERLGRGSGTLGNFQLASGSSLPTRTHPSAGCEES